MNLTGSSGINMKKKSRTLNFSPKSYALIWDFQNISKIKFFYPNLRLRVCLVMCLIFQQSEPSVLINRLLTEEKKCIALRKKSKKFCWWLCETGNRCCTPSPKSPSPRLPSPRLPSPCFPSPRLPSPRSPSPRFLALKKNLHTNVDKYKNYLWYKFCFRDSFCAKTAPSSAKWCKEKWKNAKPCLVILSQKKIYYKIFITKRFITKRFITKKWICQGRTARPADGQKDSHMEMRGCIKKWAENNKK